MYLEFTRPGGCGVNCLHKRQVGSRTRVEDVFIREKWENDKSLH